MELEVYKANKVPEEYLPQLRSLTLPHGMMWGTFTRCRNFDNNHEGKVVVVKDDEELIGWGLRWRMHNFNWTLHLFVSPSRRREGIGTVIAERAVKGLKMTQGCPWNDASENFYRSLNVNKYNLSWLSRV